MMAPIPGLTVADTCESHTLAPRSGLGHRVFGVGASSPGVLKHHRGGVSVCETHLKIHVDVRSGGSIENCYKIYF